MRCALAAAWRTSARCAPGLGSSVRRSRSRQSTTGWPSTSRRSSFTTGEATWRSPAASAWASRRRPTASGATRSRARASSAAAYDQADTQVALRRETGVGVLRDHDPGLSVGEARDVDPEADLAEPRARLAQRQSDELRDHAVPRAVRSGPKLVK